MPRLTIGIDASRGFDAEPTGTEVYAREVICHLVRVGAHRVRLYARQPLRDSVAEHAEVTVLGCRRLWTHRCLRHEVARRAPDVLFVPAHVLPVGLRVPAVVTVHDLGHRVCRRCHTWCQWLYLEWSARYHVRRARFLVADSEATRRDLERWYGADGHRVVVVHLGVSRHFEPAEPGAVAALKAELGLPADAEYIAHVGTVQPRKNLERLVAAFARCAASRPRLWLVLVGRQGWGGARPLATAQRLGVGSRVRWLGYLSQDRLPALYSGAVITAFPSLYEGFGLPALEAMACGGVVAASDVSSLPEVVGDGGVFFDPTDVASIASQLERLLEDAPLRAELSWRGRERARGFTWERCADQVQSVLERAAQPWHEESSGGSSG